MPLQIRLLRVLQERVYEPLGATRSEKADVRVIAATNRDLWHSQEGTFREDLYYRINVVRVELPPLRRRKEDIPLLVEQFIARFNRVQGKRCDGHQHEALSLLMAYDWPGNVRELENAIEHAFILCSSGRIGLAHLPEISTGARRVMSADGGLPPAIRLTHRRSARRWNAPAATRRSGTRTRHPLVYAVPQDARAEYPAAGARRAVAPWGGGGGGGVYAAPRRVFRRAPEDAVRSMLGSAAAFLRCFMPPARRAVAGRRGEGGSCGGVPRKMPVPHRRLIAIIIARLQ